MNHEGNKMKILFKKEQIKRRIVLSYHYVFLSINLEELQLIIMIIFLSGSLIYFLSIKTKLIHVDITNNSMSQCVFAVFYRNSLKLM